MYQGTNPKALQSMRRIEDALVKLMRETPYESVSVTAICKEAGISRPTFYKNFNDKDEVVTSIFKQIFERAKESYRSEGALEISDAVKMFVAQFENKEAFVRMLSNGKLFSLFQACLLESLSNETSAVANETWTKERLAYLHAFYSGGLACLLLHWSGQEDPVSIGELENLAAGLVDGSVYESLQQ